MENTVSKESNLLFESIADDLSNKGYSVRPNAIPSHLTQLLVQQAQSLSGNFFQAGIGRQTKHLVDESIRKDKICWINDDSEAGKLWLSWMDELKQFLNRRLFLGLNYFESHFAHYSEGDFYKKHKDAFVGQGNRILSTVTYLNQGWLSDNGGELVIYNDDGQELERILPQLGTLVVFLSEEYPHEVLISQRERYSIAGWYRSGRD